MTNEQLELIRLADAIELEMKKIGLWLPNFAPQGNPTGAFGGISLKFEEWLQGIFLPNLRMSIKENNLPKKSQVSIAAIRNFDGFDSAEALINLLSQVDELINQK